MAGLRVVPLSNQLDQLPAKVRAARLQRGLSHRLAAAEIGMQYADLCRFEKGHLDCRASTLRKIADWVDAQ